MSDQFDLSLEIDLVFKLSKSFDALKHSYINKSYLVFDCSFWKFVFKKWMKYVILEKGSKFPQIFKKSNFSLSLQIIDNNEIQELNKRWLNKSSSTDVLSFPIVDEDSQFADLDFIELGDLFVSYEKALSQSLEQNHSIQFEILWLVSHGFLHLLGWEHSDQKDLDDMINFQHYLISELDLENQILLTF